MLFKRVVISATSGVLLIAPVWTIASLFRVSDRISLSRSLAGSALLSSAVKQPGVPSQLGLILNG